MKTMKKKEALNVFMSTHKPANDYYKMQLQWTIYLDFLQEEKCISRKQRETWTNPCKPNRFTFFKMKHLLVFTTVNGL